MLNRLSSIYDRGQSARDCCPCPGTPDRLSVRMAGFTMIELVMTIVILGSSTLIMIPFFSAIGHNADPIVRDRAVILGQAMMDEIISKRWDENSPIGGGPIKTGETVGGGTCASLDRIACYKDGHPGFDGASRSSSAVLGPESGESRANYDDIDDYNGINVTDGNFRDQNDKLFVLAKYKRRVDVDYISSSAGVMSHSSATAAGTTDSKRVVVTVTSPQNEVFYFTTVLCNI